MFSCNSLLGALATVLLAVATLSSLSHAQGELPMWTAPHLNPLDFPYGGARPLANVSLMRLYFATPEIGTYNMSPMFDFFYNQFMAIWKCAPQDEDQPGQRILWSHSSDGKTWTPTDGTNELFPNMSTTAHPAALFAEPFLHINGRVYAAASPTQFCLYPDQYFAKLLLREVDPTRVGAFGKMFWAAGAIPAGFEEASALRGVVTLKDMDAQTQADIAMLQDPMFVPCNLTRGTAKCEYCLGGCQPWSLVNVTGLENERTHFVVPHSSPQRDVLFYRSRVNKDGPNWLYASLRNQVGGQWSVPARTNITDDVANINAGSLPDGRVYLLNNALITLFRDPLFLTTSADGVHFNSTGAVATCESAVFKHLPQQPYGCMYRHKGGAKEGGLQYPQGMAVTAAGMEGFYAIFSLNKEDIWVARVPFASI